MNLTTKSKDDLEQTDKEYLDYWSSKAKSLLSWQKEFHTVLDWQAPYAEWFVGGKLNAAVNCLDRHIEEGHGDRIAYYWEGEPGDRREISYRQLHEEVCRLANSLRQIGVERGDRVIIYLPQIPELPTAMLACARIGAVHSVVFSGLSSDALADRINDASAGVLITADGIWDHGRSVPFKALTDEVLDETTIQNVIVVRRTGIDITMKPDRDLWYHELIAEAEAECLPDIIDSEELLYLLYTSGATAEPKGIMHTTGGYLTQVATTMQDVFAMQAERDVYWCDMSMAWAAGHSYAVYGPLLNGLTSVMYEGSLEIPDQHRAWQIIARYGISHVYCVPAAIRLFMLWGPEIPAAHDLSTFTFLASFGETLYPEVREWFTKNINNGDCKIVNTWWQTEAGAQMLASQPDDEYVEGAVAVRTLAGQSLSVVDAEGHPVEDEGGYLVINRPWPGMLRGVWDQPKRYREEYWQLFSDCFYTGDYARINSTGAISLLGRTDDLIHTVAGVLSPVEAESALNCHTAVAESAIIAVGTKDEHQQAIAFVAVAEGAEASEELDVELCEYLEAHLGNVARPQTVAFTERLPRAGDGKLMRRLLRDVVQGRDLGDTTALQDDSLMAAIRERAAYPENWCWRNGPINPGNIVLVDIDGTIADAHVRMKGIEDAKGLGWLDFMAGAIDDPLIEEVARLLDLLNDDVAVVMLSARPISIQDETREWLERHKVRWDLLILRATSSIEKPLHYKRRRTHQLRERGFEPVLSLEDDKRNVDMYHEEGVPCLYIHSGIHS
jgi:acetyl-CoA synthetase